MTEQSTSNTLSVAAFVEVLRRSQLISEDDLPRILKTISASTGDDRTASTVAEHLVTSGHVTKWQAAQLLKGKYRGFLLGKYRFRKPLGRGGMGVVFEAEHLVLGTRVAIKVLPKERGTTDKAVSRFLAEARAAAKLNHPNVLRVHDCDVFEGRQFMVMDLIDGANLGELVDRNGPLSYRNAIELLRQAAAGLGFAHESGVIHRDVKPHNFMVDKNGQLKVADLGLALFQIDSPERYTQDGNVAVLGTVDYVAPEQAWDSRKVDRRADMYSLGCTLYFMLTGKAPFDSGSMAQRLAKHQASQPTPIQKYRPDCPAPIVQLCSKMMAKKPAERVQRMQEIVAFCETLLPKLAGTTNDLVGLAGRNRSQRSGSGSSVQASEMSYYPVEAGFDTMLGSDSDKPTSPDLSHSQGGDLSFLADALPLQPVPAASSYAPQAQGAYWQQAAQAKPAAKPKSKKEIAESRKNQILLICGLVVASLSVGLTLWQALKPAEKVDQPRISTHESGDDGKVIIIHDK
jgi:eukaryotic-like serine/threonine-protein kinase